MKKKKKLEVSKLLTARISFILCLAGVAGGMGYAAHKYLTQSEQELAQKQFHSIAERALTAAQDITMRKRLGGVTLAAIFSNTHPNADDWPNVALDGFNEIALDLVATSDGRGFAFMPIVYPDKLEAFEEFAYDYYETKQRPPFEDPESSIPISSFGRGVYGVDPALDTTDNRYHATGNSSWGGKNLFIAPFFHVIGPDESSSDKLLLFDHYSKKDRGLFVDDMKDCSDRRVNVGNLTMQCTSLSDSLFILSQQRSPGAVIFQPIYPANNPEVFAGYISSSIVWDEVLENVFAEEVSGIECILETETQKHRYRVTNGHATYIGEIDHRPKSEARGLKEMSIVLTGEGLFTDASATYTLRLYPTDEFFETYSTRNPESATIGAVVIIILTSLAFLVYDSLVRQEFNDARAVLEAKRQFMRYVSHEVRTPLNTVVMGLKLLQEEVNSLVGGTKQIKTRSNDSLGETSTCEDDSEALEVYERNAESGSDASGAAAIDLSNQILSSAESAVSVLNDLLNYDRIEMGELPLELTIVPIWRLIEKSMQEFILPFEAKKIEFTLDFKSLQTTKANDVESQLEQVIGAQHLSREVRERRVVGDAIRLTQVLRNLVSNALKFTPENGHVTIDVSWQRSDSNEVVTKNEFVLHGSDTPILFQRDGALVVVVRDSGVGMTEEQLSRLFQRGLQFNVNELQAGKGSGLGLYIAKGICERHGGSLTPSSAGLGKGTAFTLTIPLYYIPEKALPIHKRRASIGSKPAHEAPNATPNPRSVQIPEAIRTGGNDQLRILVVDDAAMNRKLLARLLSNAGHECDQAEDGQQAIDRVAESLATSNPYQVILMDFEMPVLNGPSAVKHIRERLGCEDTFIGGVTGNVLPDDVAHFKRCGADWVFCKPVRIHDLEAIWADYGVIGASTPGLVETECSSKTQDTVHTQQTEQSR